MSEPTPKRKRGRPTYGKGLCRNPGWSVPEDLIQQVNHLAELNGIKPSEMARQMLIDAMNRY